MGAELPRSAPTQKWVVHSLFHSLLQKWKRTSPLLCSTPFLLTIYSLIDDHFLFLMGGGRTPPLASLGSTSFWLSLVLLEDEEETRTTQLLMASITVSAHPLSQDDPSFSAVEEIPSPHDNGPAPGHLNALCQRELPIVPQTRPLWFYDSCWFWRCASSKMSICQRKPPASSWHGAPAEWECWHCHTELPRPK